MARSTIAEVLLQEAGHESVKPSTAIVGGQAHVGTGSAEIVDACRQVGAAHAIVKRHTLALAAGGPATITARAKQIPYIS